MLGLLTISKAAQASPTFSNHDEQYFADASRKCRTKPLDIHRQSVEEKVLKLLRLAEGCHPQDTPLQPSRFRVEPELDNSPIFPVVRSRRYNMIRYFCEKAAIAKPRSRSIVVHYAGNRSRLGYGGYA